jgi:hypothetical protein
VLGRVLAQFAGDGDPKSDSTVQIVPSTEQASDGGGIGYPSFVFALQFAQLAVYPQQLLPALSTAFNFDFPDMPEASCPFPLTPVESALVGMVMPLISFGLLGVLFVLPRLLASMMSCAAGGESTGPWARVRAIVMKTAAADDYLRATVLMCLNNFESIMEAAFAGLICEPTFNVVYAFPSISCASSEYTVLRTVSLAVIGSLGVLPVGVMLWLWWQYRRHGGSLSHLVSRLGPLFAELKPRLFWYQGFLLLRRAVVLAVFVPMTGAGMLVLAKICLLFLVVLFAVIHHLLQPYSTVRDNNMEFLSLLVMGVLVGLYASGDSLSPALAPVRQGVAVCVLVLACVALMLPTVESIARSIWSAGARQLWQRARERFRRWRRLSVVSPASPRTTQMRFIQLLSRTSLMSQTESPPPKTDPGLLRVDEPPPDESASLPQVPEPGSDAYAHAVTMAMDQTRPLSRLDTRPLRPLLPLPPISAYRRLQSVIKDE